MRFIEFNGIMSEGIEDSPTFVQILIKHKL